MAIVGLINPVRRGGWIDEFEQMLPPGVQLIKSSLDIREQTEDEFLSVLDEAAARVDDMAAQHADLIHPIGAPVFMVHGYEAEQRIIGEWEEKHGVPIFTSGQSHVNAMRALGIHRFVGLSPLSDRINAIAAQYFRDAGFEVLALQRARAADDKPNQITWQEAHAQIKELRDAHPTADGVYFISSGWRILDAVPALERDLDIPVVHPVPARVWEIQRRLGLRDPRPGLGRLVETLPPGLDA